MYGKKMILILRTREKKQIINIIARRTTINRQNIMIIDILCFQKVTAKNALD
jgi:hypothetical protein